MTGGLPSSSSATICSTNAARRARRWDHRCDQTLFAVFTQPENRNQNLTPLTNDMGRYPSDHYPVSAVLTWVD